MFILDGFLLVAFVLLAIWAVAWSTGLYNSLVAVRINVDTAWSNIDVALKERHDELGKLIDAVASYTGYEQQTLKDVTSLRMRADSGDDATRLKAEGEIENAVPKLLAIAENYPELHASQNFAALQAGVSASEERLAHRREFYNAAVAINNARLSQFPDSLFAALAGLRPREMFAASDTDRADVDIRAGLASATGR